MNFERECRNRGDVLLHGYKMGSSSDLCWVCSKELQWYWKGLALGCRLSCYPGVAMEMQDVKGALEDWKGNKMCCMSDTWVKLLWGRCKRERIPIVMFELQFRLMIIDEESKSLDKPLLYDKYYKVSWIMCCHFFFCSFLSYKCVCKDSELKFPFRLQQDCACKAGGQALWSWHCFL